MEGIFIMQKYLCICKKKIIIFLKSWFWDPLSHFCHTCTHLLFGTGKGQWFPRPKSRLVPENTNTNNNLTNLTAGIRLLKQEGIYTDFKFQLLSACLSGNAVVRNFQCIWCPIILSQWMWDLPPINSALVPAYWQSSNIYLTIIIYQLFMAQTFPNKWLSIYQKKPLDKA